MSIKYELSLWRDYPGSTGIREEKIATLATTGMDFAGRAQNIKLKREYTGKTTLEFEIPVKYIDPFSGEFVKNPLCSQVMEKSKIKLWRDELWYNPFGGTKTVDSKTGITKYAGAWEQGRWYDLVVDSHKEKRSKKQLFYSYTCNSLFISELSRNGYSLQFVPNTDVMSSNGMGTAHDLAERIVDGTDWEYVKTEVFPDYKEEFNAVTGETVKTPVSTDQVEFAKGLERYCYCYEIETSEEQTNIKKSIEEQLKTQGIEANIVEGTHYGFTNNKFWWKGVNDKNKKNYGLGHIKTDISFNGADSIVTIDCGGMRYYTKTTGDITDDNSSTPTGVTTFSKGASLWTAETGSVSYDGSSNNVNGNFRSYLKLSAGGCMVFKQSATKPMNQGDLYCVKIKTQEGTDVKFEIKDHLNSSNAAFTANIKTDCANENAYDQTYWFTVPTYISQPYFYITDNAGNGLTFEAIYIYEFKGSSKEINQQILELRSKNNKTSGLIEELLSSSYTPSQIRRNIITSTDTSDTPIWLGFGKTTVEGYQKESYIYLIEYEVNGKYCQIYLPVNNNKNVKLSKISSYETDKRRQIKGEKSNRFTLIETISKTFNCFTRFIVEHDSQGRIKLENGHPIKRFTFVSELGRKNFNGFNYGVNLDNIERTIDANNLVTKCHVESISNQYTDSNMVTIQESKYNKLGMTYIYNFSYYLRRGLLDKSKFLKDYQRFTDDVNRLTQANLTKIESEGGIVTQKTSLETDISTYEIMLESYKSIATESLATIGWDRFINGEQGKFSGHKKTGSKYNFPDIDITTLTYYNAGGPTGYTYYTETKPIFVTDKSNVPTGKYYIPNRYRDIDELAQYIAYNRIGSVRNDSYPGVPPSIPATDSEFWGRGLSKDTILNELNKVFSAQADYKQTKTTLDQAYDQLEKLKIQVDAYNAVLEANNKEIQRKVTNFERKYIDYITEGQWKGNDYIDADAYYLDATRAMSVSCMPKVGYTIGAIDLSQLSNPFNPEDTDWGKEFSYDVGDTTYVKDEELFGNTEQLTMIATITTYVDLDKQDDIEMRNYETRFEELFQQVAAAVTSVQFNENIWGKAAGFTADGGIDETILQKAFNNNKNLVIASANNTVTQDNKGITVKDNDTGRIVRLIGGGLFLSSDGGNTYKAGITPDGINALLITTGQLDTSKIVIRSTDTPNFELTNQGLTAYGTVDNRITRFDQFGIYSSDKAGRFTKDWWISQDNPDKYIIDNSVFSLTRSGLNFRYAKGGLTFGTLDNDRYGLQIKNGNDVTIGLYDNGDATFSGTIKAKRGNIGGWTIGSVNNTSSSIGLYKSGENNQSGVGMFAASATDPAIWAGYTGGTSTPYTCTGNWTQDTKFYVLSNGTIKASEGTIGGWHLSDDSLYTGRIADNNHYYWVSLMRPTKFGSSGIGTDVLIFREFKTSEWSDSYTDHLRINSDGTLVARKLNASGGKIGGWTIGNHHLYGYNSTHNVGSGFMMDGNAGKNSPAFYAGYNKLNSSYPDYPEGNTGWGKAGSLLDNGPKDGSWFSYGSVTVEISQSGYVAFGDAKTENGNYLVFNPIPGAKNSGLTIKGKIVATSGSFDNCIIKNTCDLEGNIAIGNSYILNHSETKFLGASFNAGNSFSGLGGHLLVGTNRFELVTKNSSGKNLVGFEGWTSGGIIIGNWSQETSLATTSDLNKKHEVFPLSSQYSVLFDNLHPVTYKYNNGTSDRLHTGFIAQEVQEALNIASIDSKNFAGLVIFNRDTEDELWTLRYEEFIALNTSEIQKLKARVAELEAKVASLTSV